MEVTNDLLTMDDLPGQSVDPLYRQYGTLHAGTSIHLQDVISGSRNMDPILIYMDQAL